RRVDPALALRLGNALDPVHAALELEVRPGPATANLVLDLVEAPDPGLLHLDGIELPAATLHVAGVHAEQVGGEEGRLLAALGRLDLDDHVTLVVGVARQQRLAQPRL